jgi:DNA topoisomerase-1
VHQWNLDDGSIIRVPAMNALDRSTRPPERLLRQLGLIYITRDQLTIQRRRRGTGFVYINGSGRPLRDKRLLYRLKGLAVPPAYEDVTFAADPRAHLQAVGRDAAGRHQYRYHPDWEKVRELRKARRVAGLAEILPRIRGWVSRHLADTEPTRECAAAALIELIALTALRPGSEVYAKANGTRGAATLLKSNVTIAGETVRLRFTGKGGKAIEKSVRSRRLASALGRLSNLPGRRIFQYRNGDGRIVALRRREVNTMLQDVAGRPVSLKDFRTLIASATALAQLATIEPKTSDRGRRRQLLAIMRSVAAELANTPAVCRRSYVHAVIVDAFESGELRRLARRSGVPMSAARREKMLASLLARLMTRAPA